MAGARWAVFLLGLLIAGCSIAPAPPMTCHFVRYELEVGAPPADAALPGQLADILREELATVPTRPEDPALASMLFMSGGGEHGAFSAGLLDEWAKRSPGGKLPAFQVVTGISTGSILATFAFTGDTDDAIAGYTITDETQLLTPYLKRKNGKIEPSSLKLLAEHGAVANLEPLRRRIAGYLTDAVLGRVRDGHEAGRRLLVGVVDVDTGQGVALDLGEMGSRYFKTEDPAQRAAIKTCYIEAIAASSSAPMAAVPSFIDNRMYVDGGMRFGMFSDEIGRVIRDNAASRDAAKRANIYLIANGSQETTPVCGKVDKALCEPPNPPTGGLEGAHAKWTFVDLAMRSERILVNQVYRFSADKVRTEAILAGSPFRYAQIDDDINDYVYTLNDPVLGSGTKTCAAWTEEDRQLLHPLQFYPRYMRCLIDYGRMRARKDGWGGG
jgi:hypothetical protein